MNKNNAMHATSFICLAAFFYFIYYLLLRDNLLPFSIASVRSCSSHWLQHCRVLVAGLLPIYIGLVIFGTGLAGLYLVSILQRWLSRFPYEK